MPTFKPADLHGFPAPQSRTDSARALIRGPRVNGQNTAAHKSWLVSLPFLPLSQVQAHPGSLSLGVGTKPHQALIRIQAAAIRLPRPRLHSKAQKTVGSRPCPFDGGLRRPHIYGLRLSASRQPVIGSRPYM